MPIEILDVHLSDAPGKVGRLLPDDDAATGVFRMERIDVADEDGDPRADPPCPPSQRNICTPSWRTQPKVAGSPQSHSFSKPSFST
jgi:hypothetical protein